MAVSPELLQEYGDALAAVRNALVKVSVISVVRSTVSQERRVLALARMEAELIHEVGLLAGEQS